MSPHRFTLLLTGLVTYLMMGSTLVAPGAVAQPATASTASLSTTQFEARLLALTNARRKKIGCPQFRANSALSTAARKHTQRMVETGSFSHQVPREAGLAPRIVSAGYKHWSALAENIAWGQSVTPAKVFSMWMHSAPHRANIQSCRLRDIGYGVQYARGAVWATGDFGRHR